MKYSRNPSTGEMEAYSDTGVYIGTIYSMGDDNLSYATDGGKGSGNFGHAGRPGKVGGSAGRGGGGGSASSGGEGSESAEKSGFGGAYKKKVKEVEKQRKEFKKLSSAEKTKYGISKGFIPNPTSQEWSSWAERMFKKGLSSDDYVDYCAARYFTMEKFKPTYGSGEYKTPLKKSAPQTNQIHSDAEKVQRIMDDLGVDATTATKMKVGLGRHFGNGASIDPWIDRYIDADSRYEGAIYRWKGYSPETAAEKLKQITPGAKISNKYGSNWSFSSSETATREFGSYDDPDVTTFCFICDNNLTASPVQHLSGFGKGEAEVIPHSQTTWTVQEVVEKKKPGGGVMYEIHMTEDDWHEEKGIPVWEYDKSKKDWKQNFPDDDVKADEVMQKIKESNNPSEMGEFLSKCPDGTEILADGKLMKKVDGEWMGYEFDLSNAESWDDISWEKMKDKAKPMGDAAKMVAMEEDAYIYQMPTEDKVIPFEEIEKRFENVKVAGGMTSFLDKAPVGTQFHDSSYDYTYTKLANGKWQYTDINGNTKQLSSMDIIDTSDTDDFKLLNYPQQTGALKKASETFDEYKGEVSDKLYQFFNDAPTGTQFSTDEYLGMDCLFEKQANGMWIDKNGKYPKSLDSGAIWTMTGENSQLVAYPTEQSTPPSEAPTSYHDAGEKFAEVTSSGDAKQAELFLNSMKDGSEFYDDETDGVWKKVDDHWEEDWTGESKTAAELAEMMIDKQSFTVWGLPLNNPTNEHEATEMLVDLKSNAPSKMGHFIKNAPVGTVIISQDSGGIVYKKTDDGWKVIKVSEHPPDYVTALYFDKHRDYAEQASGLDVMKTLQSGGIYNAQVAIWGKE